MKGDLNRAFDEFISTSQNTEIPDAEAYILLGQNLSAALENLWGIYISKNMNIILFDCSHY